MSSNSEKDKIINKVLLLYLVNNLEKPTDMDKLQNLVFLCQTEMQEHGVRGFTYDWVMKEDK